MLKIWDVATGRLILTLKGHLAGVQKVAFSPDGRLASGSFDGTVRLWDARPGTPKASQDREALGLLDFLFAKPLCKSDVLAYLRSSPTLRPQAREKALALINRYREEQGSERYHQAAWTIIRQPYLNAFQYRFALRQAETARRLAPEQSTESSQADHSRHRNEPVLNQRFPQHLSPTRERGRPDSPFSSLARRAQMLRNHAFLTTSVRHPVRRDVGDAAANLPHPVHGTHHFRPVPCR
jgi:hypothetical protein